MRAACWHTRCPMSQVRLRAVFSAIAPRPRPGVDQAHGAGVLARSLLGAAVLRVRRDLVRERATGAVRSSPFQWSIWKCPAPLTSAVMTALGRSAHANFSSLLMANPAPFRRPLVRISPSTALKCAGSPSSAKSPLMAATAPRLGSDRGRGRMRADDGPVDAGLDGEARGPGLRDELQDADLDGAVRVPDGREREAAADGRCAWLGRAWPRPRAWPARGSWPRARSPRAGPSRPHGGSGAGVDGDLAWDQHLRGSSSSMAKWGR